MACNHIKRCLTLLTIQEMQNQNHNEILPYTCSGGHYQKNRKKKQHAKDAEKLEPLCPVGVNVKRYSYMENSPEAPQKT